MLRDVRRVISFMDVLYHVGDQLYKRSLRYTGVTATVSLLGYLGNYVGTETYSAHVALALPLIVGFAALAGGLVLKTIPTLIAARLVNIAEAQDLDLMEDYRKSREELHLESLWDRVYRHEWELGTAATRVHLHADEAPARICRGEGGSSDPEQGRQQFLARARFGLDRPQPQPRQRYYLGLDLRFLEDWRNGAYFDRDDRKLVEQFEASATIEAVKRETGYGLRQAIRDFPLRFSQKFWFMMVTRAMSIQVGDVVSWLNRRYDTDYFNVQVLLWPGEDREPWLDQFPGAAEEIRSRRKVIFDRIFGTEDRAGGTMIERIVWPSFWFATKLRAAYDPEYVDGSLGYDIVADLEEAERTTGRAEPYRRLVGEVAEEFRALATCLTRHRPELLEEERRESLRAARIAVHLRRHKCRRILLAKAEERDPKGRFERRVLPLIDAAVERKHRYSERLLGLRVHHELTRLHRAEYLDLLAKLRHPQQAVKARAA